ncbi:putative phage protein [Paenibacillus sp. NAIST15-1]|nr:putative phage protein [Paenibacillus sp. NAIST15-1]
MEVMSGELFTVDTLTKDFEALGVQPGMNLILHSSMKSLGSWVAGGASAVILALEEQLSEQGTLVMPTHTVDLSDPSTWQCPPLLRGERTRIGSLRITVSITVWVNSLR